VIFDSLVWKGLHDRPGGNIPHQEIQNWIWRSGAHNGPPNSLQVRAGGFREREDARSSSIGGSKYRVGAFVLVACSPPGLGKTRPRFRFQSQPYRGRNRERIKILTLPNTPLVKEKNRKVGGAFRKVGPPIPISLVSAHKMQFHWKGSHTDNRTETVWVSGFTA